ncbi:hypothetical protein [Pseudomonas cremoricolorata]|uniref:Uncharacterized protein n=1 Tax=Pseudomonas cremoricolorata TaxID=157783 RepID=A0A089WV85_9PSED|nr:hypothetical protein [Pseudomonas cremoricolorata]AIR90492.1 hypothetical protein LK03_14880 [Pseudomonas cremoricolorata]
MARLIAVLGLEVSEWPEGIDHFFCDPDGEVRGSSHSRADFYPKNLVDDIDRGKDFGDETIHVTEADWKEFRLASGIK